MKYKAESIDNLKKKLQKLQKERDAFKKSLREAPSNLNMELQRLRKSEEKYRLLLNGLKDAVYIYETLNNRPGRFVEVNESACRMLGYTEEEFLQMKVNDIAVSEHLSEIPAIQKALSRDKTVMFETYHLAKNGGQVPVDVYIQLFELRGKPMVLSVARDITERKLAEEELRKSKMLLKDIYKHLEEIRENERAVISREIHDQIGQSLTALKLDMNWLKEPFKNANPETATKLQGMIELISQTIKDVQRISSDLRPGILDDLGLPAAIEWYCEEFEKRTGIRCSLKLDDSTFDDSQKNLVFFRVLQEALTNVIRHADASSVSIILHQSKHRITLTIHDNGIGIPEEKIESYKSLGLISMRERMHQFDGKFVVSAKEGNGTKLTVFIPK